MTRPARANARTSAHWLPTALLVAAGAIGTPLPARASPAAIVYNVDSTGDDIDDDLGDGLCHAAATNKCTLRAAVMQANVAGASSTIVLPAGTYTLIRPALGANGPEGGDLNLTTPLSGNPVITIAGAGAATTIIDANGIDRAFRIEGARQTIISGVTITNGTVSTEDGGGIYNGGASLLLSDSTVSYNSALSTHAGGGIYNRAFLTLTRVKLDHNQASGGGGAIDNIEQVTVDQSTLSNNQASGPGGAIRNIGASLKLKDSVLTGNGSTFQGGAVYIGSGSDLDLDHCQLAGNSTTEAGGAIAFGGTGFGTLKIDHSTLSGNTADIDGGAIYIATSAFVLVANSTLSGNTAKGAGGAISNNFGLNLWNSTIAGNNSYGNGGALRNFGTAGANLYNATIVYNQADADANGPGNGGGIYNTGTVNIRNTVVAGNYIAGAPNYSDCVGILGIYGNNFLGTGAGCTAAVGSPGAVATLASLDELGVLSNNGGPTLTVAPVPPTGLIDNGAPCIDPNTSQPLTTDQRGVARVFGAFCDIGAFEYGPVVDALFASGFE